MTRLPPRGRILLVDDDVVFRTRLGKALQGQGFRHTLAGDFDTALALFERERVDVAILDLRLPGRGGIELLTVLRARSPALPVVMLSGFGSIATAVEAVRLGAVDFVTKPANAAQIVAAFNRTAPQPVPDTPPSLARTEWEHIQRVLQDCGGNITRAAEMLGIDRRTLQRKLARRVPRA